MVEWQHLMISFFISFFHCFMIFLIKHLAEILGYLFRFLFWGWFNYNCSREYPFPKYHLYRLKIRRLIQVSFIVLFHQFYHWEYHFQMSLILHSAFHHTHEELYHFQVPISALQNPKYNFLIVANHFIIEQFCDSTFHFQF